jgi:activator of 2-hydroxyglutaryl-CoA dehydratase
MQDQRNELDIETVGEAFHRAPEEHSAKNQKGGGLTLGLDTGSQKGKATHVAEDIEVRRGGALDSDKCRPC